MSQVALSEPEAACWPRHRPRILFLAVFLLILAGGFSLLSVNAVNDRVVEPFTAGVARTSGTVLNLIGQSTQMRGTIIENGRFAVNIKNGCNGVETMTIFLAAVFAFPASFRARAIGLVLGLLAIQLVNLVRVVALFLTGAYFPRFFDHSHTVLWQTLVVASGILLFIFWADRFAVRHVPADPGTEA